jgi:hypothetical protein
MKKAIIFDASGIISLAMNGLLPELKELKKIFDGKFLMTSEVKKEVIDKPLTIKRFELEALRIKQLLDEKIFELPSSVGIKDKEISEQTNKLTNIANNLFIGKEKEIPLISPGEASCLVFSKLLEERRINNLIVIDERTMRMLVEKPENLRKFLQKKLHTTINVKKENFSAFRGFKIIRSAELVYVAYKKGAVKLKDGKTILDALLWAVKLNGCSISVDEINEIKKLG